ncbi:hypothetical protein Ahy_A08g038945 isoform B [Arachis hypogaea]|uniref:Uncharacterized protein n=1 Tax=Arachis hypogaea TaxID=3818 RepID=A0A445BUT1_ARAHY|nr:hypothetical protein Ahy_A08g038945 isoform B [Arachis hypogaea]
MAVIEFGILLSVHASSMLIFWLQLDWINVTEEQYGVPHLIFIAGKGACIDGGCNQISDLYRI